MPGLLGDALPWAYSQGDRAKRYLNGLLNDPLGTAQQAVGQFGDNANYLRDLLGSAFADPKSFQPTNQNALSSLVQGLQNGPMGFAPVGMTTWHGTPHTFDKFDASKIGTGEGAQMYGHGIYTAEAPEVAKQYAANVKDMGAVANINAQMSKLADIMHANEIPGSYRQYRTDAGTQAAAQYDSLMAQRSKVSNAPGNLYKVDLPDDQIAKMLDWDAPLSKQPENVRAAFERLRGSPVMQRAEQSVGPLDKYVSRNGGEMTGQDMHGLLYEGFASKTGGEAAKVAKLLREQGIPGIRYLDQASRNAGGTSNFVVFPGEENMLSILARNGQPVR